MFSCWLKTSLFESDCILNKNVSADPETTMQREEQQQQTGELNSQLCSREAAGHLSVFLKQENLLLYTNCVRCKVLSHFGPPNKTI